MTWGCNERTGDSQAFSSFAQAEFLGCPRLSLLRSRLTRGRHPPHISPAVSSSDVQLLSLLHSSNNCPNNSGLHFLVRPICATGPLISPPFFFLNLFFWLHFKVCGILVPQPGTESASPWDGNTIFGKFPLVPFLIFVRINSLSSFCC